MPEAFASLDSITSQLFLTDLSRSRLYNSFRRFLSNLYCRLSLCDEQDGPTIAVRISACFAPNIKSFISHRLNIPGRALLRASTVSLILARALGGIHWCSTIQATIFQRKFNWRKPYLFTHIIQPFAALHDHICRIASSRRISFLITILVNFLFTVPLLCMVSILPLQTTLLRGQLTIKARMENLFPSKTSIRGSPQTSASATWQALYFSFTIHTHHVPPQAFQRHPDSKHLGGRFAALARYLLNFHHLPNIAQRSRSSQNPHRHNG